MACFTMLLLQLLISLLLISLSHGDECPLQLDPQRAVVRYGGSVEVTCNNSVAHKGMGWEASEGGVPMTKKLNLITWRVINLTEWDINPYCYINLKYKIGDSSQCLVKLPVTVYKTPDSVSISTVNHRGPMKEGQQYELQCDVHDVAPVQYLTVKWYKGQTLLHQTNFSDTENKTLVNKTVTLLIRPDRDDDGAQYWCEAELDLGAKGPQPPPKINSSEPLNVEVYYKPQHSSSTETIIKDDKVMLDCSVKANPAPDYTWSSDHLNLNISSSVIKSSALSPGKYTCNATNILGSDSKVFILKSTEDYLPLIAGLIAVIVVFISFIFISIYLIYYKKVKMGHYILRNAKPSAQNGNIAQNGKQNPIPMKKLSQSSVLA